MALAILEEGDFGPGGLELVADLGTSTFYDYRIGADAASADGRLADVVYTSELARRPTGPFATTVRFRVPVSLLRGARGIQLTTYRDERRNGATWSRVLTIRTAASGSAEDPWSDMMSHSTLRAARTVAFAFREAASKPTCGCRHASAPRNKPCGCNGHVKGGRSFAASAVPAMLSFSFGPSLYSEDGFSLTTRFGVSGDAKAVAFARAILEAQIRDVTGRTLATATARIEGLKTGDSPSVRFDASSLAAVPRGAHLQFVATLRCKRADGRVATFEATESGRVVGSLFVESIGASDGRETLLDQPERDRAFWHRFWAWSCPPGSDAIRWDHDVLARYYLRQTAASSNGRIETRAFLEPTSGEGLTFEQKGRLRSGLEVSLHSLNALLPVVAGTPMLTAPELGALAGANLEPKLSLQATVRLRAQGKRANDLVAWAVPAIELVPVLFRETERVEHDGRIISTRPVERMFPFPSSVKFFVLRSDRNARPPSDGGPAFEGYETVEATRVALEQITLVDVAAEARP